jgi:FKBP-type peptidyl-prolyl cis-trans isomerase 2
VGEPVIEDNLQGEPREHIIGAGQVPPGVDEVLYDMAIGEVRTALIPCEKAYGEHQDDGVVQYPRFFVKGGDRLKAGIVFGWEHPVSKREVPVRCIEATDDTVTIDFNHLLAGLDLEYTFELVDVLDENGNSLNASA